MAGRDSRGESSVVWDSRRGAWRKRRVERGGGQEGVEASGEQKEEQSREEGEEEECALCARGAVATSAQWVGDAKRGVSPSDDREQSDVPDNCSSSAALCTLLSSRPQLPL